MAANVRSAEFVNDTQLFTNKQSANTWRLGLSVASANTVAEGVVKQSSHCADVATVDGTAINTGSSATDQTSIGTIGETYSETEVKNALTALAEKINYLTYRLEQAGIMADS